MARGLGRGRTTLRGLAATGVTTAALLLGTALPALAHDDLIASDPAEGQALETAPDSVSLTFTSEVLTIGAALVVADATGADWVASDPEVDDGTVTAALETGMPDGAYQVRWRVVSEDGHPISGLVPFTVGDAELLAGPVAPTAAAPTAAPIAEPASTGGAVRTVLIGAAGAAVAVGGYALALVRRRENGTSDSVEPTSPTP